MRIPEWLKRDLGEVSKSLVRIAAHGMYVLAALVVEGLVAVVLQFPQFAEARAYIEPVLKVITIVTVGLMGVVFLSLLAISGWEEIRKRHAQAQVGLGGWLVLSAVVACSGFMLLGPIGNLDHVPMPKPIKTVDFHIPRNTRGPLTTPLFVWPVDADAVRIQFFVRIRTTSSYRSKLDEEHEEELKLQSGSELDGIVHQVVLRQRLKDGPHRLVVEESSDRSSGFRVVAVYLFESRDAN